ncbi:hypothetical protein [Flavobacterium psychraquaticum]|uniref:hypothetical protein n=1 Tax=Flavobacterium psychraquaticum TaxID=3103958 RepID=UPI002ACE1FD8|nr:hypothetical protein [Flavobacterium sp. LB-N7T]
MVLITDYKVYTKETGENFIYLVVQGGVEAVVSKATNKTYLTARTARVSCTFDESMCMSLIGTSFPGTIAKVKVDPYQFVIEQTGEVIERHHRYEYMSDEDAVISQNVHTGELVE